MLEQKLAFQGTDELVRLLGIAAGILVAGFLIWKLLQYERRLVSRRVGRFLLGMRLGVLALLLLTFLKPVWSWSRQRSVSGHIVVAVDLSQSMQTADSHAPAPERLRLARALKMVAASSGDDQLGEMAERLEDRRQSGRNPDVDDGLQDQLAEILQRAGEVTRKQVALQLLSDGDSGLLQQLQQIADVRLLVFSGMSEVVAEEELSALVDAPPERILTEVTDLSDMLRAAVTGDESSRLLGVVVLTDGRDTGPGDALGLAVQLGQMEAPVVPLVVGTASRPRDLSVATIDYPRTTFRNDRPLLKATMNTSGFAGSEVTFRLESDGLEPQEQTVRIDSESTQLTFPLDASDVGRREYVLSAAADPLETRTDNNDRAFAVTVVDDKVRVLIVEGDARWEFRFIDNALTRDERVEVSKVVFEQPYLGVLEDTFFPRQLPLPTDVDNLRESPFSEADLVIIGDLPPAMTPPSLWLLLEKYVSESGGTVLFEAGKRHFPLAYRDAVLNQLLPVDQLAAFDLNDEAEVTIPTDRGVEIRLTSEGEQLAMLQFDADPARNEEIWRDLPGHLWGIQGRVRPGATILASMVDPLTGSLVRQPDQAGVIVHQHYGFGQVIWLGIDSTWRWRHRVGDTYHHRFWGQLARWAAENKVAAGNSNVRFGPTTTDVEFGADAVFLARFSRDFLEQHPGLELTAEILDGSENASTPLSSVQMSVVPGRPMMFEGRAVGLPVGRYRVRLKTVNGELGNEPIEAPLYVRERLSLELSDITANLDLLTELASRSRGRLVHVDEADQVAELFRDRLNLADARNDVELWDHWFMMVSFFLLLTVEWVVRKLHGLP